MRKFQNVEGIALQMLKTTGAAKSNRRAADRDEETDDREEGKE